MKYLSGMTFAAALLATPALADICSDASTQTDMNRCAADALAKADTELNALYNRIHARLKDNKAASGQLTGAQRAWVAFRDSECTFASSGVEGGSLQPFVLASCKEELTRERNTQLGTYLKCEEGDVSCPVPAGN